MDVILKKAKEHQCSSRFKWNICEKAFQSHNKLKKYKANKHQDQLPYRCDKCNTSVMTPEVLEVHIKVSPGVYVQ